MRHRLRARPAALAALRGPLARRLGSLVRDGLTRAVVPRHRDERGLAQVEGATQGGKELPYGRHREAGDAERPRELDEARIAELGGESTAEDAPLVRFDDPEAIVDEYHAHDRGAQALRRLELLDVHQETAVPTERDDFAFWKDELCRDRTGKRDTHRGEPIRHDDRVRHRGRIEPREPHLVRADVAHHDVLGRERLPDRRDDKLGRERGRRVFRRRSPEWLVRNTDGLVLARFDVVGEHGERLVELTHNLDRRLIVAVELGGGAVDVHDHLVPFRIPERRRPLDEVVPDRDHQIGLRELRDVRELRTRPLQTGGRKRLLAERIEHSFRHVGVGREDPAPPNETPERFHAGVTRGLAPRDAVARKDDRRLRALDELERAVDHRVLRLWIRGPADLERLHVGVLSRDVLGCAVQRERRLAGDPEDVPYALVLETFHEQLRDVQRAASPMSRSTITVSRHAPSSLACRRYVPTSRKPTFASSLRLASFSGKTRERSFHMPRPSHSRTSASIAARPAPVPRASRAT